MRYRVMLVPDLRTAQDKDGNGDRRAIYLQDPDDQWKTREVDLDEAEDLLLDAWKKGFRTCLVIPSDAYLGTLPE
jgi:hypothetical protein